jgi:hypothetical protein
MHLVIHDDDIRAKERFAPSSGPGRSVLRGRLVFLKASPSSSLVSSTANLTCLYAILACDEARYSCLVNMGGFDKNLRPFAPPPCHAILCTFHLGKSRCWLSSYIGLSRGEARFAEMAVTQLDHPAPFLGQRLCPLPHPPHRLAARPVMMLLPPIHSSSNRRPAAFGQQRNRQSAFAVQLQSVATTFEAEMTGKSMEVNIAVFSASRPLP